MPNILFVCTGNIFRSLSAEYLLKAAAPKDMNLTVSSAGTVADIEPIHPDALLRLNELGIDPAPHIQRKVTQDILDTQDLVISMSIDHKRHLTDVFGRGSMLFYEASLGEPRAFPDLWEIVPDYKTNKDAARLYLREAVGIIHDHIPNIIRRLPELLR